MTLAGFYARGRYCAQGRLDHAFVEIGTVKARHKSAKPHVTQQDPVDGLLASLTVCGEEAHYIPHFTIFQDPELSEDSRPLTVHQLERIPCCFGGPDVVGSPLQMGQILQTSKEFHLAGVKRLIKPPGSIKRSLMLALEAEILFPG
jgi:hypothetical protein